MVIPIVMMICVKIKIFEKNGYVQTQIQNSPKFWMATNLRRHFFETNLRNKHVPHASSPQNRCSCKVQSSKYVNKIPLLQTMTHAWHACTCTSYAMHQIAYMFPPFVSLSKYGGRTFLIKQKKCTDLLNRLYLVGKIEKQDVQIKQSCSIRANLYKHDRSTKRF